LYVTTEIESSQKKLTCYHFWLFMQTRLRMPADRHGALWQHRCNRSRVHFLHWHRELEAALVIRGTATYLVGERKFILSRNALIWMLPRQDHVLLAETADSEMWMLVFSNRLLRGSGLRPLLRQMRTDRVCRVLPEARAARLRRLCAEIAEAREQAPLLNAGLSYWLLTAWAAHARDARILPGSDVHPAVEKAAHLLHQATDVFDSGELARRAGLSLSRLRRLFKEQTGVSLVDYRNKQRLERFFLLYGDGRRKKMMQAALEAGFGSYPQFHRVFKASVGCGPAIYRRNALI
jgi:AraC-like DNA-binding protein